MDIDIEQRVIQQGYCIDISNLKRIFMQYLIDTEMVPEVEITNQSLKTHILECEELSANLTFLKPKNPNLSEVIVKTAGKTNVADCFHKLGEIQIWAKLL